MYVCERGGGKQWGECVCVSSGSEKSMLTFTRFAPAGAGIFKTGEGNNLLVLRQFLSGACNAKRDFGF